MKQTKRSALETSPTEPSPERAALFSDISRLTGMPFPNLIYRVLANEPGRLESCWSRVRPGLARTCGPALRHRLLDSLPVELGFATPNLREGQRRELLAVLDAYDSGNSCNAVLVRLLLEGSRGRSGDSPACPAAQTPMSDLISLPELLEFSSMSPRAQGLVANLARTVDPSGDVVPSLFRHLAHDEDLLQFIAAVLETSARSGGFARAQHILTLRITTESDDWPTPVEAMTDATCRVILERFVETIPRMLGLSALMRSALG